MKYSIVRTNLMTGMERTVEKGLDYQQAWDMINAKYHPNKVGNRYMHVLHCEIDKPRRSLGTRISEWLGDIKTNFYRKHRQSVNRLKRSRMDYPHRQPGYQRKKRRIC